MLSTNNTPPFETLVVIYKCYDGCTKFRVYSNVNGNITRRYARLHKGQSWITRYGKPQYIIGGVVETLKKYYRGCPIVLVDFDK